MRVSDEFTMKSDERSSGSARAAAPKHVWREGGREGEPAKGGHVAVSVTLTTKSVLKSVENAWKSQLDPLSFCDGMENPGFRFYGSCPCPLPKPLPLPSLDPPVPCPASVLVQLPGSFTEWMGAVSRMRSIVSGAGSRRMHHALFPCTGRGRC